MIRKGLITFISTHKKSSRYAKQERFSENNSGIIAANGGYRVNGKI